MYIFLCVSCGTGILRSTLGSHSRNLAFVFGKCQLYCSSNRNKRETASLPGRFFSAVSAGILTFLAWTCLPPQLYEKRMLTGKNLNQIWNMVSTVSYHFYQEVLSLEHCGLLRTYVPLLLRDRTFFYLMNLRAFLPSARQREERNGTPVEK